MQAARAVTIAVALTLALNVRASAEEPASSELTGMYIVMGSKPGGEAYNGRALITPRGNGYEIDWYFPHAQKGSGFGILVDHVFAAVRSFNEGSLPGTSLVAYRITGGELTGTRLSGMNSDGLTGREVLKGSPDLTGRFDIVASTNPYGETIQSGHVEIARSGDFYSLVWYTPDRTYFGSGLKVGDLLVVGYRRGKSPGVIAYCIANATLRGGWVDWDNTGVGQETLQGARKGAPLPVDCQ